MGRTAVVRAPEPTNLRGRFSLLSHRPCQHAGAAILPPQHEPRNRSVSYTASSPLRHPIEPHFQCPQVPAVQANLQARARGPLTTPGMDAPAPLSLPGWKLNRGQRRQAEAAEQSCLQHPHKASKIELRSVPSPYSIHRKVAFVRLAAFVPPRSARSPTRNSALKSSRRTSWW